MRTILSTIAASALIGLAPASSTPPNTAPNVATTDLATWEANVLPCRLALAAHFSPARDEDFLDRYIAANGFDAGAEGVQRVLCAAYTHGALDMAEGSIVPLDPN